MPRNPGLYELDFNSESGFGRFVGEDISCEIHDEDDQECEDEAA